MPINEEINDKEVRVVGQNSEQLGLMSAKDALKLAMDDGLDLVKIAPNATPPVCRIMDYGKYRYEQARRVKDAKKNQKTIEVKEIRMSLNIDIHDFNTKVNSAIKMLKSGYMLKVTVRFRGREMMHPHLGVALLERFKVPCAEVGIIDKEPKMEGRGMSMFISSRISKEKDK